MKLLMVAIGAMLSTAAMLSGIMRPITVVWTSALVIVLCQVAMFAIRRAQRRSGDA